jgi:hypothetical protein
MNPKLLAASLAAAFALAPAAFAHHSGASFDAAKTVTVTGVVKAFDWTNPHTSVLVTAPGKGGAMETWDFECSSVNIIARHGWSREAMKPGDKVTVVAHPMKDGSPAGLLRTITLPGGKTLEDHMPTPQG